MDIAKNLQIVRLNDQHIKQWIYSFATDKRQNRQKKNFKFSEIVRIKIVGNRTLYNLLLELVSTDFSTDILTNSTDIFILLACVRRALLLASILRH